MLRYQFTPLSSKVYQENMEVIDSLVKMTLFQNIDKSILMEIIEILQSFTSDNILLLLKRGI